MKVNEMNLRRFEQLLRLLKNALGKEMIVEFRSDSNNNNKPGYPYMQRPYIDIHKRGGGGFQVKVFDPTYTHDSGESIVIESIMYSEKDTDKQPEIIEINTDISIQEFITKVKDMVQ